MALMTSTTANERTRIFFPDRAPFEGHHFSLILGLFIPVVCSG
jgi:hypothetical protein